MYLYIGGTAIPEREIIGLFDLDGASRGRSTLTFLETREKSGCLLPLENSILPRSFIVAENNGTETVYYSPVTTETLRKRML